MISPLGNYYFRFLLTKIEFVVEKVREDFGDLFVQIIEYVYPDKDISAWKENLQVVQKDYIAE